MHVDIKDHHTPCVIKLLSAPVAGSSDDNKQVLGELKEYLIARGHLCEEFLTERTLETIKRKYTVPTKFYYPNSLYIKVTLRPHAVSQCVLNLNRDNVHTLDIFADLKKTTLDYESIADVLIDVKKKYRYLL